MTTPPRPKLLNEWHLYIDAPRHLEQSRAFQQLIDFIPPGELLYAAFQEMYANDPFAYELVLDAYCPPADYTVLERYLMNWIDHDYFDIKDSFDTAFEQAQGLCLLECHYRFKNGYISLVFCESRHDYEKLIDVTRR